MKLLPWIYHQYRRNTFIAILITLGIVAIILVTFGLGIFGIVSVLNGRAKNTHIIYTDPNIKSYETIRKLREAFENSIGRTNFLKNILELQIKRYEKTCLLSIL